jgi:hypothetical protein
MMDELVNEYVVRLKRAWASILSGLWSRSFSIPHSPFSTLSLPFLLPNLRSFSPPRERWKIGGCSHCS